MFLISNRILRSGFIAKLGLCLLLIAPGGTAFASRNYGQHEGYLTTVEGERGRVIADLIVVQPPKTDGPSLQQKIFNDKLNKEFSDRYEEKFGRTEVERVYNSPNRFTYYDDMYGFKGTPQQVSEERRNFADFMIRRLAEYHVDHFAQTNQSVKAVWEAKEKLSKVNVEVSSFRFNVNYQIAGNVFDMKIDNPYLDLFRYRLQMNAAALGPGPVEESTLSLGRPLTKKLYLEAHYKMVDGVATYIARRSITPALGSTLTVSTFTKDVGTRKDINIRESLYLAGLSYVF